MTTGTSLPKEYLPLGWVFLYKIKRIIRVLDRYKAEVYNLEAITSLAFRIDQMYGKMDFTHYLSDKHTLDFGASSLFYDLEPGKYLPYGGESLVKEDRMEKEKAVESAIYVGDRWDITSQLSLNVGVRYSMFNVLGPRTYNLYADDQLPSLATVTGTVDKTGAFKTYRVPGEKTVRAFAFSER